MLTRSFPFLDPTHISPDLTSRLHALADDCERLSFGQAVPLTILESAPLLTDWAPVLTPGGLHLVGHAVDHPVHGSRMVMTTPLWWADRDGRWIRTLSRFYRLGSPADLENVHRLRDLAGDDGAGSEA